MSTSAAHENNDGQLALHAASRDHGVSIVRDRFLFLRHGRTPGNIGRIYQHPDIPLAAEGFGDADIAGKALCDHAFDLIYCSDMARAWLTAGRVADCTGRPVWVRRCLRERYFGDFIGTPSVGLDWRVSPPNGETMHGFIERTLTGVTELLVEGPMPLLVSHGGVLRVLAGALDITLPHEWTVNGLPLAFERKANAWTVTPLIEPAPIEQQLGAA
jgi:broad specificity phosphatase PhoE